MFSKFLILISRWQLVLAGAHAQLIAANLLNETVFRIQLTPVPICSCFNQFCQEPTLRFALMER